MINQHSENNGAFSRRSFLKTVAGAGAFTAAYGFINIPQVRAQVAARRNVILFITDQERAVQWFPEGWADANLPNFTALRQSGILFDHACTNSAMCTPSRNTIFTGQFPAQHLSLDTLTEGFEQSETEHQLDPTLPNLATVLKGAGYEVVFKGKWHLSKGVDSCDGTYIEDDIARYGFDLWDPPDAGQDVKIENYGGGIANNDQRFVDDAVAYLQSKIANPGDKPFCLVVSLVNPHDLLGYPGNQGNGGYTEEWLHGDIGLPPTVDENLITNFKPTCQEAFLVTAAGLGVLGTPERQTNYINFYGNLLKLVDSQLGQVLDVFNSAAGQALRNNTWIIRTADHGEMGMSHGGLRQKSFVCYEEMLQVPMVWSNPVDFPAGRTSSHLVSHVDLLPTLCAMLGIDGWEGYNFAGIDYSSLIRNAVAPAVQDYVLFTSDDIYAGQNAANNPQGLVNPPNRIQAIRTANYKYVRYFDGEGQVPDQEEFYDLRPAGAGGTDVDPVTGLPIEAVNLSVWAEQLRVLSGQGTQATLEQITVRTEMMNALPEIVNARLQPLPAGAAVPPENFTTEVVEWTDPDTGEVESAVQITWLSRSTTQYQLQQSTDGRTWRNTGDLILGNNGPILLCQPVSSPELFYRLAWSVAGSVPAAPIVPAPAEPAISFPTLEFRGARSRAVAGPRFDLAGKTNSAGNRIDYKIGAKGVTRSRIAGAENWTMPIRGLRIGANAVLVRAIAENGEATGWKRLAVRRLR